MASAVGVEKETLEQTLHPFPLETTICVKIHNKMKFLQLSYLRKESSIAKIRMLYFRQ